MLLDGLLVNDDCDLLFQLLLFAGEEVIELCRPYGGQDLSML
jgi:hypothetical protein